MAVCILQIFLHLIERLPDEELRADVRRHHEQHGASVSIPAEVVDRPLRFVLHHLIVTGAELILS